MSTSKTFRRLPIHVLVLAVALAGSLGAQTKVTAPKNGYSVADDVKLGRDAAEQAKKELPMLNDGRVDDFVENIGRRLVAAIPAELKHPEFTHTFDVVDQKEINAFALPGGPMFLNRGMMEAAESEGEVAGVMAHEISHVALRHGTAQATKGQKYQIGSILGQVAGAIIGGTLGSVVSQGTQFGLGVSFMRFSREYESQADILGAQMMARAGYNPLEMANMFKTIEGEGGNNGPEFLSDHPNPGNRYNAITKEAQSLRVQGNADSGQFASIKSRLNGMPPAYTAEQIAKGQAKSRTGTTGSAGAPAVNVRVYPPSAQTRTYQPAQFLRVTVPANWQQFGEQGSVTYAPQGGVGDNIAAGFTHGVQLGTKANGTGNLQSDTDKLIQGFAQSNPNLRQQGGYQRDTVGGRQALTMQLSNTSDVTGKPETIVVSTTRLKDGSLLYIIGVSPQDESTTYQNAFRRVRQTVRLSD